MEALEHWRRSCERLAKQLRLEALRNALLQWQDLVISERLTVRFAHAAQMIKMGPGTAGSSPTSSPGTSRKSRIEVRRKSEMRRPADEGSLRHLQALDVARRYALGALAIRKTLLHLLTRRLQKTMATWRHAILPPPLQQLLSHTRGDGSTATASLHWRALSGPSFPQWLRRHAQENQVSHYLHHDRRQHCFLATRLLRSVLRLAVLRVVQGSWQRWRSNMAQAKDSSIAQVPRVSNVFSASKRGTSGNTSVAGASIGKELAVDLHAPLTHPSQFLPWGRQPHQELSQKQLFEHLAAKHGSSEAALHDLREAVATALKDHPAPRKTSDAPAAAKLRL